LKRTTLRLVLGLLAIGLMLPGTTPVAAADALGMIETRGLFYEDFSYERINNQGEIDRVLVTATGSGDLLAESYPGLSGTLRLRQAFEVSMDPYPGDYLRARVRGRTAGLAEIVIERAGGESVLIGPVAFSGSVIGIGGNDEDGRITMPLVVHAATTQGHRFTLELTIVIDIISAGFSIADLTGDGSLSLVGHELTHVVQ
jgi:hypothetical protein